MNPITILALASAAMQLVKESLPVIRDAIKGGEVSEADQERVLNEYNSLRTQAGGEFSGPEWELSGR